MRGFELLVQPDEDQYRDPLTGVWQEKWQDFDNCYSGVARAHFRSAVVGERATPRALPERISIARSGGSVLADHCEDQDRALKVSKTDKPKVQKDP